MSHEDDSYSDNNFDDLSLVELSRTSGISAVHRLAMIASIESLVGLTYTHCGERLTQLLNNVKQMLVEDFKDSDDELRSDMLDVEIIDAQMQIEHNALEIDLERLRNVVEELNSDIAAESKMQEVLLNQAEQEQRKSRKRSTKSARVTTTVCKNRLLCADIDEENIETPPDSPNVNDSDVESVDPFAVQNASKTDTANYVNGRTTTTAAEVEATTAAYDIKTQSLRPKVIYSQEFLYRYAFPPVNYQCQPWWHYSQQQQQQQQQCMSYEQRNFYNQQQPYMNFNFHQPNSHFAMSNGQQSSAMPNQKHAKYNQNTFKSCRNPMNLIYALDQKTPNNKLGRSREPDVPGFEPWLLKPKESLYDFADRSITTNNKSSCQETSNLSLAKRKRVIEDFDPQNKSGTIKYNKIEEENKSYTAKYGEHVHNNDSNNNKYNTQLSNIAGGSKTKIEFPKTYEPSSKKHALTDANSNEIALIESKYERNKKYQIQASANIVDGSNYFTSFKKDATLTCIEGNNSSRDHNKQHWRYDERGSLMNEFYKKHETTKENRKHGDGHCSKRCCRDYDNNEY